MNELFENFEKTLVEKMKESKAISLHDYKIYTKNVSKTCDMLKTFHSIGKEIERNNAL